VNKDAYKMTRLLRLYNKYRCDYRQDRRTSERIFTRYRRVSENRIL